MALNVNCYITKPVDMEQFIEVVKGIDNFWFTVVTLPAEHDYKAPIKSAVLPEPPARQ